MGGSWFTENFNDFSDEFFDVLGDAKHSEALLEDIDPCDGEEDWETKFRELEPPPLNILASFSPPSLFETANYDSENTQISSISCDESRQIKQWPLSVRDTANQKYVLASRTCSPVSVLDNSNTSVENLIQKFPKLVVPAKRPRSKRFHNRRRIFSTLIFPAGFPRCHRVSASESDSGVPDTKSSLPRHADAETRRCSHCQVSKTPQWREGPLGPKTLCNACGVRFRSGRLYPEYRPAASPTFTPSLHSNSHRKVLEMRKKSSSPASAPFHRY